MLISVATDHRKLAADDASTLLLNSVTPELRTSAATLILHYSIAINVYGLQLLQRITRIKLPGVAEEISTLFSNYLNKLQLNPANRQPVEPGGGARRAIAVSRRVDRHNRVLIY